MRADDLRPAGERLYDAAGRATSLLARVDALRPSTGEGRDPSGAVTVIIGGDGVPSRWTIARDWALRLSADRFDAAVLAACRAAAKDQVARWGDQLDRNRVRPGSRSEPAPMLRAAPPSPPATGQPDTSVRGVEASVAAVLDLLSAMRPSVAMPGPRIEVVGRAGNGRLLVELGAGGLSGCRSDPAWVAEQTGARLQSALNDAVEDARTQRDRERHDPRPDVVATAADQAADQAMTLLRRLAAPTSTSGHRE